MDNNLLVVAKEHTLQGLEKNEDILSKVSVLEAPLEYIISDRLPNAKDYDQRRELIRIFNDIARDIYGNDVGCPIIKEFGSFLMDIFDPRSDLDLSINFGDKKVESQREGKIRTLRKFGQKLRALQKSGHVRNIQSILTAKVPVLKVTDCGSGIECDLSVGNLDGIAKSDIIHSISAIDERFQKLCFLVKAWAKAHDINSSKDGTLNSLSLILLVAFHLQTRNPPIFPPFSAILKGGTDPLAVKKIIPEFANYGKKNKESLAELFVSLLIVLESVETLWSMGLCASVFEGSWVFKQWKTKKSQKFGEISIEDFTDRTQNTARAVRSHNAIKIHLSICNSLHHIRTFTSGDIDEDQLKNKLFDSDPLAGNDNTSQHNTVSRHRANRERKTSLKVKKGKKKERNLEKRNKTYHLPSTSSQKEVKRVYISHESIGGVQSSSVSQCNLFNQHSTTNQTIPTKVGTEFYNQGSLGFNTNYIPDTRLPQPYQAQHYPYQTQQYQYYHPQSQVSRPQSQFSHPQSQVSHPQSQVSRSQSQFSHPQSQVSYPQSQVSRSQSQFSHPQPQVSHPQSQVSRPRSQYSHPQSQFFHPQSQFSHPQPQYPQPYHPPYSYQPPHPTFENSRVADDPWSRVYP